MTVDFEDATARPVPGLGKVRRGKLPTLAERVLPNGLRVVAVRRASVPVVHVRLRIPTAVRRDADLAKSRLMERAMLLGAAGRDQSELAEALQRIGGSLRASSDADRMMVAGESLAGGLTDLLGLLAELLMEADYPKAAVEGERARVADQTHRALSQPGVIADEAWLTQAFGSHPYRRDYPTPQEVLDVSPATLRTAHRRRMVPAGSLLVLVGDLSPARTLDRVETVLGEWTADGGATRVPKVSPMQPGPLQLVDRPGAVQSNLRLGGPALPRTDPSYAVLELTNALFGGYFSSRLVRNIREDKGYTYSPRSSLQHGDRYSFLLLQADVATEVTAPAMLEVGYELGRLASVAPSEVEVRDTAQYLIGALALSASTQAGLAATLSTLLAQDLDVSWLRDHPKRLLDVTPDEVHEMASRVLAPSAMVTTVVGDASVVSGPLAALGRLVGGAATR